MTFAFALCLFTGLALLAFIDARTFRLPDMITLPLIGLGLFFGYITGSWQDSLIGAALGYAAFVGIEITYRRLRGRDGLGRGDAKLLAAGGAWCGWLGLPFIVLIASGTALLAALFPTFRQNLNAGRLPFGPFLAFGIAVVWLSLQLVG